MDDPRQAVQWLRSAYSQILKPKFESLRAQLDPLREPVKVVLLDAWLERMEILCRVGEENADKQLIDELKELEPWLFKMDEVPASTAHGKLGEILQEIGFSYSETHEEIERARRAPAHAPRQSLRAIEALEMKIAGYTPAQIAERLLPNAERGYAWDSIRHLIKTIEPVYEHYKRRK